ncbi:MAG: NusG domain II-containing protein [Clostridia bacterium]|nr:NusG domain II-containing protein [Clostridia bacterium]
MKDRIKAGDIVIIAGVILLAVTVFLLFLIPSLSDTAAVLEISCNNEKMVYTVSENREIVLESKGYTLRVCIEDGSAYVASSDCPDKTCVHTGRIDRPGKLIACVPSGITLRIIGEEDGYDFVAG